VPAAPMAGINVKPEHRPQISFTGSIYEHGEVSLKKLSKEKVPKREYIKTKEYESQVKNFMHRQQSD